MLYESPSDKTTIVKEVILGNASAGIVTTYLFVRKGSDFVIFDEEQQPAGYGNYRWQGFLVLEPGDELMVVQIGQSGTGSAIASGMQLLGT